MGKCLLVSLEVSAAFQAEDSVVSSIKDLEIGLGKGKYPAEQ